MDLGDCSSCGCLGGTLGAERLGEPLRKLWSQRGLTQVAGASLVGIAAASPEIGIYSPFVSSERKGRQSDPLEVSTLHPDFEAFEKAQPRACY